MTTKSVTESLLRRLSSKGVSLETLKAAQKVPDFDTELLRESKTLITINDNGQRIRISKHEAVIKQLLNKAINGNIPAARTYLDRYQVAFEKVALLEETQSRDHRRRPARELSNEELEECVTNIWKKQQKEKEHVSNAD